MAERDLTAQQRLTRVSAYGACVRDERILLVHQAAPGPAQGRWTLPGGGIEFGEHPVDAVVREVFEETGLRAEVGRLLATHDNVYDAGDGVLRHGIRLIYAASVRGVQAPIDGQEIDAIDWFPLGELPLSSTEWVRVAAAVSRLN